MKNNIFNRYVKKYDLRKKELMDKFHHTYRVIEYSREIAKSENMNEREIFLAETIGLLHDIGRFEQFTEYHTFKDFDSIDHGDLSYNILTSNDFISDFVDNEEDALLVLKAVKNHNKKEVIGEYTEEELKYIKLIRDADKLDIIKEQYNQIKEINKPIDEYLFENIYKEGLLQNTLVQNSIGGIFRHLTFVYDLNYKYSFELLKNEKIIENKINLLEIYVIDNNLDNLEELKKINLNFREYIDKKIEQEKI